MKRIRTFVGAFVCVIAVTAVPPLPAQTQKTPRKQASLATLIQSGRRDEALERIRARADLNEPQPDGTRPIHWAVYRVDYELVDALIAKKAKVNVTNDFGSTPIAEAAKLGDARFDQVFSAGSVLSQRDAVAIVWNQSAPNRS